MTTKTASTNLSQRAPEPSSNLWMNSWRRTGMAARIQIRNPKSESRNKLECSNGQWRSGALSNVLQLVRVQLAVQRAPAHPEFAGGEGAIAAALLESALD